ncbi:MAG: hypothetical protein ACOYMJ_05085 [Candidatus Methylopumilus universalis]
MTIRSGGTRAWRCNNRGNLKKSDYSTGPNRRSIGIAGDGKDTYAVYPDYKTGHEALIVMLSGSRYSPLSLRAAMRRYDSKKVSYIDEIVKITKFDPERLISSLNDDEFEEFWMAIEYIENWTVGSEDFIEKWVITGVHKNHGVITEYLVKNNSCEHWISKHEAIAMANTGQLHAIFVHMNNRNGYLRPPFHNGPFKVIDKNTSH